MFLDSIQVFDKGIKESVVEEKSVSSQIRNFLLVILSAITFAVLIAAGLVYFYNPSGRYRAENVLLSPEMTQVLSYSDKEQTSGMLKRYVFEGIEYNYFDGQEKIWKKVPVSSGRYEQFYDLIKGDVSYAELNNTVFNAFNTRTPAMLILKVRPESNDTGKTFQEVQFVDGGDYYRITIHDEGLGERWAYFYHKNISNEAKELFAPQR